MMTKASKRIRVNNIKFNAFYVIIGVVVTFTATTTTLFVLYSTLPSFDYRAFAQGEDNKTVCC